MDRAAVLWFLALLTGIGFGYFAWGEPDRRADADLVRDLAAITRQLERHERTLAELVDQREAKMTAALAECELTAERVAKQLEGCLFDKAEPARGAGAELEEPRALSGTAPVHESTGYPVPIPPKPVEEKADVPSPPRGGAADRALPRR
jgi:hypothetical protein